MKSKLRRVVAILVLYMTIISGIVLLGVASLWYVHNTTRLGFQAMQYLNVLARFATDHKGRLPASFDELVSAGYVIRGIYEGRTAYFENQQLPSGYPPFYAQGPMNMLDSFYVRWGARPADFFERDGRIYSQGSRDEECFLLSLKFHGPLRPESGARSLSRQLLEIMTKASTMEPSQ